MSDLTKIVSFVLQTMQGQRFIEPQVPFVYLHLWDCPGR